MILTILKGNYQINLLKDQNFGSNNIELIKSHITLFEVEEPGQENIILEALNISSEDYRNIDNLEIFKNLKSDQEKDLFIKAAQTGFSYVGCKILSQEEIDLIKSCTQGDNSFDRNNIRENLTGKAFWEKVDSKDFVVSDPRETNFIDSSSQEYKDAAEQCSIDNPDDCEMCGS